MADEQPELILEPVAKRTRVDDAIDTSQQVECLTSSLVGHHRCSSHLISCWDVGLQAVGGGSKSEAREVLEAFGKHMCVECVLAAASVRPSIPLLQGAGACEGESSTGQLIVAPSNWLILTHL